MSNVPEKIWLELDEREVVMAWRKKPDNVAASSLVAYVRAPEEPKKERYEINQGNSGWAVVCRSTKLSFCTFWDGPHAESEARALCKRLNGQKEDTNERARSMQSPNT